MGHLHRHVAGAVTCLRAKSGQANGRVRAVPGFLPLLWLFAVLGALLAGPAMARQAEPLQLDDSLAEVPAWPAVTILSDPSKQWQLADVLAQGDRFEVPAGAAGTVGLRKDAVWLHIPLAVAAGSDGHWVLDINYAVLNRADVYVVRGDEPAQHLVLGNMQPLADRPMMSRSHAAHLKFDPGSRVDIWMRVETLGGMILPITFQKPSVFHKHAIDEQLLQGLLTGLGAFLVLYSLAQWLGVREPMYWKYALLTTASLTFSITQFGLGSLYLWRDNLWIEEHIAAVVALTACAATFLFVQEVLVGRQARPVFSRIMFTGAGLLALTAVLYVTGLIHVHQVSWVVGTLGLLPALMGLPGAVQRARRGDQVGWYFLVAWLGYFISTFVMVSMIKGRLPANWWTLHSFQLGATLDMILFMRVMSLRLQAIHAEARHAQNERETLLSMAHTDALTGLPNRRGLSTMIEERLAQSSADEMTALYLLDLDGFKQVNDMHGHDVGDELLVAVALRLRRNLREDDVVSRMGGDEFVVAVSGLRSVMQAEALGQQLVRAFQSPFQAGGQECSIGLTAGFVLAPIDGHDFRSLMKAADLAMYAAKDEGKNRVRRGYRRDPPDTPSRPPVSADHTI